MTASRAQGDAVTWLGEHRRPTGGLDLWIVSCWQLGAKIEESSTFGKFSGHRNRSNVRGKHIPRLTRSEGHCALCLEKVPMSCVTLSVAPSLPPALLGDTDRNNMFYMLRCSIYQPRAYPRRRTVPNVGLKLTRKVKLTMPNFRRGSCGPGESSPACRNMPSICRHSKSEESLSLIPRSS